MELYKKIKLTVAKVALNTYFLTRDGDDLYDAYIVKGKDSEVFSEVKAKVGDCFDCYFYTGSDKKEHISLKKPLLTMNGIGYLECTSVSKIGAFFDIGYDKDVLMPFNEMRSRFSRGDRVLAMLYMDKSGRACVTEKIKKHLIETNSFKIGDIVSGTIYHIDEEQGVFVAIDSKYFGLILTNDYMPNMKIGDVVTGRVTKVREDGKINITPNKRIDHQMEEDSSRLLQIIEENGGYLPFDDKTDSDVIRKSLNMSKRAFKRSLGRLLKDKKITLQDEGGIKLSS